MRDHHQPLPADTEDIELEEEEGEEYEPPRPQQRATLPPNALPLSPTQRAHQSADRQTAPAKNAAPAQRASQPAPVQKTTISSRRFSLRSKFYILLGVLIFVSLWLIWYQVLIPTFGWFSDQWHYGDTRITQLDANVGHGGTSHFLAEYYQGEIVVMEISLSHPTDYHVYTLTGMIGATNTPVIVLSVQDINHDGKPDLIIQVEGTSYESVLYNTGAAFSENEG